MKCLVIIPVHNEGKHIASVVRGVLTEQQNILVIDDGSVDSTPDILKDLGVPFIRREHKGKGAALRAGFRYGIENGFEWVITMDGDGQHDFRDLPLFKRALQSNGTDMIIGSRMNETGGMPLLRLITNRFMSYIISKKSKIRLSDTQCGFRAIRCRLLKEITLKTAHYDTESEIIIRAARAGFRISSIPVNTIYNGAESSVNKITDTVRFIKLMRSTIKDA